MKDFKRHHSRPNLRTRPGVAASRKGAARFFWISGVLVLINGLVIGYHGNPFDLLSNTAEAQAAPSSGQEGTLEGTSEESEVAPVPADPLAPAALLPAPQYNSLLGLKPDPSAGRRVQVTVRSGDSLAAILQREGVTSIQIDALVRAVNEHFDLRGLRPGHRLAMDFDGQGGLRDFQLRLDVTDEVHAAYEDDGWNATLSSRPVDIRPVGIGGTIESSLWHTLIETQREKPLLVGALVNVFAWEVDFYTEVQKGDRFRMVVEKKYADGEFVGYGRLLAAEFVRGEVSFKAFRYETGEPDMGPQFYDEKGNSTEKQLLKAPVEYGIVTSTFGRRRHPVLGYTRSHNGVDYGVPTGTPIWSVGEGTVVRAGWGGGFGKLVEVRHPNGWMSQYAHLSRINVNVGEKVRQKQIVGLSGSTGLSTGPHLHYGLKKEGRYVNPAKQDFKRAPPLKGAPLETFLADVGRLGQELDAVSFDGAALLASQ